jgi:hypothetical protein
MPAMAQAAAVRRGGRLINDSQAYFSAHREVMPKARHANSVSF